MSDYVRIGQSMLTTKKERTNPILRRLRKAKEERAKRKAIKEDVRKKHEERFLRGKYKRELREKYSPKRRGQKKALDMKRLQRFNQAFGMTTAPPKKKKKEPMFQLY